MNEKRERRNFSEEFKSQLIQLYNSGKPKADIRTKVQVIKSMLASTKYQRCAEFFALLAAPIIMNPRAALMNPVCRMQLRKLFKKTEVYTRRTKTEKALEKKQIFISRRKITRIMKDLGLESAYSRKKFKAVPKAVNDAIPNVLERKFNEHPEYAAVVSDLTYVRVNYKWNYICA